MGNDPYQSSKTNRLGSSPMRTNFKYEDASVPVEPGNIDLTKRPVVKNQDGTISTVRSIGVNLDGKEYLLPTVTDDGRLMSDEEAIGYFKNTGRHLGVFKTPEASTAYAQKLHKQQESMYRGR